MSGGKCLGQRRAGRFPHPTRNHQVDPGSTESLTTPVAKKPVHHGHKGPKSRTVLNDDSMLCKPQALHRVKIISHPNILFFGGSLNGK